MQTNCIKYVHMTYLNFEAVFVVIGMIALFTIYVVAKLLLSNPGSVKNQQTAHQWFLIVGGMLLGMGIASQVRIQKTDVPGIYQLNDALSDPTDNTLVNSEFVFGILTVILGIILILIGSKYIQLALWNPLEQVSEYSSEFGKSFLGTRLPLLGGKELQRFSERFNDNISELANKISTIQIYVNNLENSTRNAIQATDNFGDYSDNIDNLVVNYQRLRERQNISLQLIDTQVKQFISLYNDAQERLDTQFTEIRSLADVGNMLSVNASIEAINMEIANPGIEMVASKLHDLAAALDNRQDELRKLVVEVKQIYEQFNIGVTRELSEVNEIVEDADSIIKNLQDTVNKLKHSENEVKSSSNDLSNKLNDLKRNLPTSY